MEERLQDRAHQPVDERVDAPVARAGVQRGVGARRSRRGSSRPWLPARRAARYSPRACPSTATRTLRGALAGRRGRRGVGGAAAARPPRLRRPLRRHRAARPLGRAAPAHGRRPASRCTSPTARCSAPSTRTSRPRCPCPPRCAGRSPGSPSTSRPGRARPCSTACTPRARTCRSSGARAARSRRPRGATCCSASCWASSSAGSTRPRRSPLPVDDATVSTNGHGSVEHLVDPGPGHALSRRVLITGASGFAGGHLAAACRRRATTSSRSRAPAAGPAASPPTCSTPRATRAAIAAAAPDVVYHLAALAHVGRSWGDPAATLAQQPGDRRSTCSRRCGPRRPDAVLVAVSSGEVYGPPATLPVDESAPLRPQNPYAVSQGGRRPARRLLRRRARAARRAPARVQPRRAGPAGALRARLVHAPGRGRARGGRRPDPAS